MAEDANRPAKKAAAKKTAAKKTAPKTASRKTASGSAGSATSRSSAPSGSQAAGLAAEHLLNLTGKTAEGVVGLEKTDEGWTVRVEVLELRRIPNTTDILAIYEVGVDGGGELTSYRRLHRYVRGTPGEE